MNDQAPQFVVTRNFRNPASQFPWLVRRTDQDPEQAVAAKNLFLIGVILETVDSYGEGLGSGPMATCDRVQSFDPSEDGEPALVEVSTSHRLELFHEHGARPWVIESLDVTALPLKFAPGFRETRLTYIDGRFLDDAGDPVSSCMSLTLWGANHSATALVEVPEKMVRRLIDVLGGLFDGWPLGR